MQGRCVEFPAASADVTLKKYCVPAVSPLSRTEWLVVSPADDAEDVSAVAVVP